MKSTILNAVAALALATAGFAAPAHAAMMTAAQAVADSTRPAKEVELDAARHPAELIAAIGLHSGQTIADIWPGDYWDRLFADVVGAKGKVYSVHLTDADKAEHVVTPAAGAPTFPDHANAVIVATSTAAFTLQTKADIIWFRQNYHDLYDPFMGPANVPEFNKGVFTALKPGGLFVVIDHSAPDGSKLAMTNTAHRIDSQVVKDDMKAAGFVFVKESNVLRNPSDPRTALVFDPKVKGHTDQFVYIFRRP